MLGILNVAKWAQLGFVYVLISMLVWSPSLAVNLTLKIIIVAAAVFITILIDNTTARVSRKTMIITLPIITLGLMALNIAVMHLAGII